MINDIRCDRCVDAVYARPDCADCERERIVAANPVPDVVPDFVTDEQFTEDILELTRAWLNTIHPIDAVEAVTALANHTSMGRAVRVAHAALHAYVEQVIFHASTTDQVVRLRIVPAISAAIKRMAPGHLTVPDDLRRFDQHDRARGEASRGH